MAESIEDNGCDIAPGIEAGSSEHVHQLFACSAFVVRKRSRKQLRATQLPLRARGKPGLGKIDEERQDSRQIGAGDWRIHAKHCALAHVDVATESFKPTRTGNTEVIEEAPVANRNVRHHIRRIVELVIATAACGIQIPDDVFSDPSAAGHGLVELPREFVARIEVPPVRIRKRSAYLADPLAQVHLDLLRVESHPQPSLGSSPIAGAGVRCPRLGQLV